MFTIDLVSAYRFSYYRIHAKRTYHLFLDGVLHYGYSTSNSYYNNPVFDFTRLVEG